jgi:transposase
LHVHGLQLLFIDEASVRVDDQGKVHIVGPVGEEHYGEYDFPANSPVRSVIMMTFLWHHERHIHYEFVEGTTTAPMFRNFIARAVRDGWIGHNHKLIMDNARIHTAAAVLRDIDEVLGMVGAIRVNLPSYSPELNPCEFVFGEMKAYMRRVGLRNRSLRNLVVEALEQIPRSHLLATYIHCTSVALRE